jgi:hypothetical protein
MRGILITLGVLPFAFGCGETRPLPLAPSPPPSSANPPPAHPATVTGVVYDSSAGGRLPLPDVAIDISVEYQSWPSSIRTDLHGRYTAPDQSGPRKLVAEKPGYSQPCRVPITSTDKDQDVYLVSDALLSTTGVPGSLPIVQPVLTGRVFRRTELGELPIAGASVVLDFSGGMGWAPSARTMTDASGRYLLCNAVDVGFGFYALVSKPGYITTYVFVTVQPPGTFDIELSPQSSSS